MFERPHQQRQDRNGAMPKPDAGRHRVRASLALALALALPACTGAIGPAAERGNPAPFASPSSSSSSAGSGPDRTPGDTSAGPSGTDCADPKTWDVGAGGVGGFKTGRAVAAPGQPTGALHASILGYYGVDVGTYGDPAGSAIPEL